MPTVSGIVTLCKLPYRALIESIKLVIDTSLYYDTWSKKRSVALLLTPDVSKEHAAFTFKCSQATGPESSTPYWNSVLKIVLFIR